MKSHARFTLQPGTKYFLKFFVSLLGLTIKLSGHGHWAPQPHLWGRGQFSLRQNSALSSESNMLIVTFPFRDRFKFLTKKPRCQFEIMFLTLRLMF